MRFWVGLCLVLLAVLAPEARASVFSLETYEQTVMSDAPELYWRLGEQTGTAVADASGHGHAATFGSPAEQRTRTGALASDADSAVQDARAWYSSAYDLVRLTTSTGLPTVAAARTVEAWVWSDA